MVGRETFNPNPAVQRYECETLGALIRIVLKKLAGFLKVGHGIIGNRQHGRSTGVRYDRVHVTIGVVMPLAYVELLAEE